MSDKQDFDNFCQNEVIMKITVDRTVDSEGDLIFTIKVTEPHVAPFTKDEKSSLECIDIFTKQLADVLDPNKPLFQDIQNANHAVKEKVFTRVLTNLKFAIENDLRPKFRPICQEIYNWIYDSQEGFLRTWMQEFDPQRTTYYFDNDEKMKSQFGSSKQEPEHVIDDVDVDDEDEGDEE